MRRPLLWIALLLAAFSLSACNVSLAADVTPPPNYQPPAAEQQPVALETAFPLVPPDPAAGADIYAEKCLPCHGATGQGDGPQAADLPNPAASLGSAVVARAARPVDWYALVTQGNLQKFMPGFSGSLNDRQRWDVVAYALTLSQREEDLAMGQSVYEESCAECHGESGRGDGPQASGLNGAVQSWAEPERLAQLSAAEMQQIILKGAGQAMPAFEGRLSEEQAWAAAAYARSLSFAGGSAPAGETAAEPESTASNPGAEGTPAASTEAPSPDATAAAGATVKQISGKVVNGSGGAVPADAQVRLLGFDGMQAVYEETAEVRADGSFQFDEVELAPERIFMATTEHNGYTFNSDIFNADDLAAGGATPLLVQVYETSTDASALVADRMHVFFDASQPGVMQIGELLIISNPTDRLIVAEKQGDPVLSFDLPEGASNLSFQDGALGERYVQTEKGFGDTYAIQPGSGGHQILFSYELPYERKLDFSLSVPLPVGAAVFIAPAGGIKLDSPQLTDMGEQDMQGMAMHLYSANSLPAGEPLQLTVSGRAGESTGLEPGTLTGMLVGGGVLLLAVVGTGYWFWQKRRESEDEALEEEDGDGSDTVEDLLDAIVTLDDLYQAGELPKEAYEERRAALKERLRAARENPAAES